MSTVEATPEVPANASVMLTKQEAATSLRVSIRTLELLIATGKVPSVKIGARRLLWRTALDLYAARLHAAQGFAEYAHAI